MMVDFKIIKKNITFIIGMIFILVFLIIAENYVFPKIDVVLKNNEVNTNTLKITEIMSFNKGVHTDEFGNIYDWIELYNGTDKDINLENYGLSDDDEKVKWLFPKITIKSKEYFVVYLSGVDDDIKNCNFSLKREGGEKLTLRDSSTNIIDSVKTIALEKNYSMIRNSNDSWTKTLNITPGFSNAEEGRNEYVKSLVGKTNMISITEILPNNKGNFMLENKLPGYIEIINNSTSQVDLSEYYLSNEPNIPYLWKLPTVTLKPNEIYLIYTDGLSQGNHASFDLKNKNGSVILSHKNKIIEEINYENIVNGLAYIKIDNKFVESNDISPGYSNNINGTKSFMSNQNKSKSLIINEVMSSNDKYLSQNGGQYYDWIEIYNNSNEEIDLSKYYLSTDKNNKTMYQLPKIKLKKNHYYVLMASGDTKLSNKNYYHTNFKLSSSEGLFLYRESELIDSIFIYNVPVGYSYGSGEKGGHYYYATPTPNKKNKTNGVVAISYEPTFSKESGVYNGIESLKLSLNSMGTIYYTLDGSEPTKNSKVYNGPIVLKKTTVVRAISYEKGKKNSNIVTNSYVINENHSLPIVSISLPKSSFNKLNSNVWSRNEYKAHAELYENGKSFSVECGIKLFGGESRTYTKKSYALKFTSEYGTSGLKYKVFDNREAVEYKTLVLRSGSQDMKNTMFKDELVASIIDDYGTIDVQASKPVILYINGKYWGIYYLREKIDEEFVNHHYNISSDSTNIFRIDYQVVAGSASSMKKLVKYANTHDLSNDKNYEYVEKKLDIDNYIDLWIAQIYSGDYDVRNVRFFNNPSIDNNKIKTIGYDFDYSFYAYPENYFLWMTDYRGMGYFKIENSLMRNLMKNKKFKNRFVERLSYNLKNIWTDENVMKNYNSFYETIKKEIKRDRTRWGFNYNQWETACKQVKNFLKNRRKKVVNQAKNFFGLSNEQVKKYFN